MDGLSLCQTVVCALGLFACDWAYRRSGNSFFPGAFLDEPAHLATALLLLAAGPRFVRRRFLGPALVASVAIDLDHLPQDLGYRFLTAGTPRPYTHSLLVILAALAAGILWRRRRDLMIGLGIGLALHFFRDLAEGNGSGVALLWPLSDHSFRISHLAYLAAMAAVVAWLLIRAALPRRRAAIAEPRPQPSQSLARAT